MLRLLHIAGHLIASHDDTFCNYRLFTS